MLAQRQHDEPFMLGIGIAFGHGGGQRFLHGGIGEIGQGARHPVQPPCPGQIGSRRHQRDPRAPPPQGPGDAILRLAKRLRHSQSRVHVSGRQRRRHFRVAIQRARQKGRMAAYPRECFGPVRHHRLSPCAGPAVARYRLGLRRMPETFACDVRSTDMEMQRKSSGRSAPGRQGDKGRVVTVALPLPYEGVGNALRSTYAPPRDGLPDDMTALLARLDVFSR